MSTQETCKVREIRNVRIPMTDGARLAGNLFLPEKEGKYPGLLNVIPYIKDSPGRGHSSESVYRHFASRGYAVVRADVRGTGTSEGVSPYPQDRQEAEDGHEIVEWMARQSWCTGKVGVWGSSNGGNSTISIASTCPPHLAAIVPINGSYDTYNWFYKPNGCDGLFYGERWGFNMAQSNLVPPLLQDSEGDWERAWRERLDAFYPWLLMYHGEPLNKEGYSPTEDYPGRTRFDFTKIKVPTFAISGWRDAYRSPMLDVYEGVTARKRLLMGPWKHESPDQALIQPVGALQEMDRWWDRWLKDIRNGVENEPPVTIFVQNTETPTKGKGLWRSEHSWPIERTKKVRYYVAQDGVLSTSPSASDAGSDTLDYDPRVGVASIGDGGFPTAVPIPYDHSADDLLSLTYTTAQFDDDVEITGTATARVYLSAPVREPYLVAKLLVIRTDGSSHLIARGWANVTRSNAHERKNYLAPDEIREVHVHIRPSSNQIRAGERLRLSLAGSDFPELWPTPEPYTMTVYRDSLRSSHIELPIVPQAEAPLPSPNLPDAGYSPKPERTTQRTSSITLTHDLVNRAVQYAVTTNNDGYVDSETRLVDEQEMIMTTHANQPWNTNVRGNFKMTIQRPGGETIVDMTSRITRFEARVEATITEDGIVRYRNDWAKRIDDD